MERKKEHSSSRGVNSQQHNENCGIHIWGTNDNFFQQDSPNLSPPPSPFLSLLNRKWKMNEQNINGRKINKKKIYYRSQ